MELSKTYTEKGSTMIMVVGILLMLSLTIIPSSAQEAPPPPCLADVLMRLEYAKSQNYDRPSILLCCPSIQRAVTNDLSCFCLLKPDMVSQDATTFFDDILQTCTVSGTLDSLCPDTSPSTPSATPTTPADTTPTTPTAAPLIASGTPSTPTTPPSAASGTPPTPTSTSSNGTINKMTTMLVSSLFVLFISFMIC
ncbi:hypothetical protein RND81_14G068800 [Saponaria officinalis]|uniref:Bifunctional inhibitor/plant lipid transfer protein/seed storage helical domain-containing protein n=1 Tax=Saponaria officinalis TaxID=3572 RepID=A0AAW1GMC4_SAPOF